MCGIKIPPKLKATNISKNCLWFSEPMKQKMQGKCLILFFLYVFFPHKTQLCCCVVTFGSTGVHELSLFIYL